jgi:nitrate reductase NapD
VVERVERVSEAIHIAGVLVHVVPGRAARVVQRIAAMDGARVHSPNSQGKLVVTLEAATPDEIAACLIDIGNLESVLSASLVYEHSEPVEDDALTGDDP